MISDKDLRDAARACEKAILETLPEPKDCPANFSPQFEKKMKKLVFRTDHPVLYWLSRILPVLLLLGAVAAALLASRQTPPGPVPIPPPSSAPAETTAPPSAPPDRVVYRPTWLPDGCTLSREALYDGEGMLTYAAPGGTDAVFLYATQDRPWTDGDLEQGEAVSVGDGAGVLRLGQSKGALNDLFWTDEAAGASFWISAPFPEEELIKMAESVEAQTAQ